MVPIGHRNRTNLVRVKEIFFVTRLFTSTQTWTRGRRPSSTRDRRTRRCPSTASPCCSATRRATRRPPSAGTRTGGRCRRGTRASRCSTRGRCRSQVRRAKIGSAGGMRLKIKLSLTRLHWLLWLWTENLYKIGNNEQQLC